MQLFSLVIINFHWIFIRFPLNFTGRLSFQEILRKFQEILLVQLNFFSYAGLTCPLPRVECYTLVTGCRPVSRETHRPRRRRHHLGWFLDLVLFGRKLAVSCTKKIPPEFHRDSTGIPLPGPPGWFSGMI